MTKRTITVAVDDIRWNLDGMQLKELTEYASTLANKYGDSSYLDVSSYDDCVEIQVLQKREESDEEYNKRVNLELAATSRNQELERQQYLRLKAKFDNQGENK